MKYHRIYIGRKITSKLRQLCLSTILLIGYTFNLNAQSDSINYEALFTSMKNCESLSIRAQEILVSFALKDIPKSKLVIDIWEKSCDLTEPSQRLNILLDIANGTFDEYHYTTYYRSFLKDYKDRVVDGIEPNFAALYDSSKSYYYYVPLRGKFDQLTKTLAISLKDKQAQFSTAYLLCVLFSGELGKFNDLVVRDEYNQTAIFKVLFPPEPVDLDKISDFGIGLGSWFPFGKLSHSFGINPTIGLNLKINYNSWTYGIEFHFRIPTNKNPFDVKAQDSIYSSSQTFSYNTGFFLARYWPINNKINFEVIGGIGLDGIQTDVKKPYQNEEGNDVFYYITTLNLNTGIGFWYKLTDYRSINLQLRYMYSPYEWDGNLYSHIGNNALLLNAYYSF